MAVMYYQPVILLPMAPKHYPMMLFAIFLTSFCVPGLSSILLYQLGVLSSVTMKTRRDRVIMMSLTTVIYLATGYMLFIQKHLDPSFVLLWGALSFTVLLTALITFFWRISAHSAGAGGVVGYFMALAYSGIDVIYPLAIAFVAAGALISARLYLQAHTILQVVAGFLLGFSISFITVYYFII